MIYNFNLYNLRLTFSFQRILSDKAQIVVLYTCSFIHDKKLKMNNSCDSMLLDL